MEALRVRKLADRSGEERVKLTHPVTGVADLYTQADADKLIPALNALLAEFSPSPYPLAGISLNDGKPPKHFCVSEGFIAEAKAEGWVTTEPEQVEQPVIRSTGPAGNPWATPPHTFVHYEQIVFHTVEGTVVYEVAENPDKWPEEKDGPAGFGGEVRHFYELKLKGITPPKDERSTTK
jgi:hypothetical protein